MTFGAETGSRESALGHLARGFTQTTTRPLSSGGNQ